MAERLRIRRYEADDAEAVWDLNERTMADSPTDPADIPAMDDLRRIEQAYLSVGGEFLVGVLPGADAPTPGAGNDCALSVEDGVLVVMGGVLPGESGHEDERSAPGAAELHRMRVAPGHQRRGFGRRLLDELESRASEAGFERLLATTAGRQRSAVHFYADAGYVRTGTSAYGEYELVHYEKRL